MNAEQAWQSVLAQLQLDMSKASFDKWLRDTHASSLNDDALVVTVPDLETRDWLEARLTNIVQRLLIGVLNGAVSVQFVVADSSCNESSPEEDDPEVALEPVQWLDYESIVQPERQVVVKGYLRRLSMEVGVKAIWLYIGFHQAAWMVHDAQGQEGSILHSREILRFSGLSFGAFWRALRQPANRDHLQGLVQRVDARDARRYRRGRDGRPHRIPVRYRVYMTPRLARADASGLHSRLKGFVESGASITDALQQCLSTENILECLSTSDDEGQAIQSHTAMEIAQRLSGTALSPQAEHLAQELHRRIVNSLGDMHITHYFITHVIREFCLTPAQAWLVAVARDMAYLNERTGERREVVTFRGGYQEMARLIGSKRPKTVQAWFHPGWAARWGGDLGRFLCEIEAPRGDGYADLRAESMPRTFRVLLDEPLAATGSNSLDADGRNREDAHGTNRLGANGSHMADADGTVKNSFKHLPNTRRETTSNTARASAAGEAAPASWELARLLERNQSHPKAQRELLEAGVRAQHFVSWILFAAGDRGKWISDPLGHAISRLRAEPTKGAGGAFDQLAALAPRHLMALIDDALEDRLGTGTRHERLWRQTLSSQGRALQTVRDILFGKRGAE